MCTEECPCVDSHQRGPELPRCVGALPRVRRSGAICVSPYFAALPRGPPACIAPPADCLFTPQVPTATRLCPPTVPSRPRTCTRRAGMRWVQRQVGCMPHVHWHEGETSCTLFPHTRTPRLQVIAKVANASGMVWALWTFHYEEHLPHDCNDFTCCT